MTNYVNTGAGIARDYIPVTPNNSADNMGASAVNTVLGFYVTVGGAVVFTNSDGTDRTVTFGDNTFVPCAGCKRIKATGTTATGIHSAVI